MEAVSFIAILPSLAVIDVPEELDTTGAAELVSDGRASEAGGGTGETASFSTSNDLSYIKFNTKTTCEIN